MTKVQKTLQRKKTSKRPSLSLPKTIAGSINTVIFIFALYTTFFGRTEIGILTLISLAIITFPSFFSKGAIKKFPVEIELTLLTMVTIQFVFGEALNFYSTVPYFDKLVHYLNPLFIGFVSFLVVYSFYWIENLRPSTTITIITVSIFTLGVGALWEIVEYTSDQIIHPRVPGWHQFQVSIMEPPLQDTMHDLILDLVGAVFGSMLAIYFIGYLRNSKNPRLSKLFTEIQAPLLQTKISATESLKQFLDDNFPNRLISQ